MKKKKKKDKKRGKEEKERKNRVLLLDGSQLIKFHRGNIRLTAWRLLSSSTAEVYSDVSACRKQR